MFLHPILRYTILFPITFAKYNPVSNAYLSLLIKFDL